MSMVSVWYFIPWRSKFNCANLLLFSIKSLRAVLFSAWLSFVLRRLVCVYNVNFYLHMAIQVPFFLPPSFYNLIIRHSDVSHLWYVPPPLLVYCGSIIFDCTCFSAVLRLHHWEGCCLLFLCTDWWLEWFYVRMSVRYCLCEQCSQFSNKMIRILQGIWGVFFLILD